MADSNGYLAGAGAGLFGALGDYLGGAAKRQQDTADAEASRKSDWEDFVTKSRFQADLNDQARKSASDLDLKTREELMDYQNRLNKQAALGIDDPEMEKLYQKVTANDPANPPTSDETAAYHTYLMAQGQLAGKQPLNKQQMEEVRQSKIPIGAKTSIQSLHQAYKDAKEANDVAQKHIVAETGLNEAQTGKILDAPYDLTVKENGLSEREKTKDNAKVTAALGGIDKAIAQHQQNIASYGAAGGQNATHAQKVAYAQKSEIAENEILRLQGMKDSYTNDQRNSAYAQLKASRNPQSRDLAVGLNEIQPEDTAGKIVQKELGKIQEDQAIAGGRRVRGTGFLGTGIGSTKWNAGGGGARLQPPGKAGEQNDIQALYKSIPQASHDLNSMQDGGIYVFPSGAGIFHKQTGMVTKLTFQDLVQTLRAQRQQ